MERPAPPYRTLPDLVQWAAHEFADAGAILDGPRRSSYSELGAAADAANRGFLAAGVEAGDRVAIWAPNSAEWILACCGLQAAGAVLVPINTRFRGG